MLVSLLEQSALAVEMRGSIWLYPLVNVVHVLGLLISFAAVAAMDARLLGSFQQVPVADVLRPCRRISATAFIVQATSGIPLFSADATAVAANPAFLAKMLVVVPALANVVAVESAWGRAWRLHLSAHPCQPGHVCALAFRSPDGSLPPPLAA